MRNFRFWLAVVIVISIISAWIVWPDNPGLHIEALGIDRDIEVRQGLDLQGGSRVLLEATLLDGEDISNDELNATRQIVERRVNGLGVTEATVQTQGNSRIVVELPGISDQELALQTIQGTGLLEFVNFANLGAQLPFEGSCILTTAQLEQLSPDPADISCAPETPEGDPIPAQGNPITGQPFVTVMTGSGLDDAQAFPSAEAFGGWEVNFTLNDEGSSVFSDFTGSNIGQPMAIVLDGEVLSSPNISAQISTQGTITGNFSQSEAESLAVQLRYGALPVPLEVAAFDTVGPTLGQVSIDRSVTAGVIGVLTVLLFMMVYYRAPGFAAALALAVFGALNFATYKVVPITLTLPAITGFLISIGTAVDGNILIFERMKEELRAGRSLDVAIRLGFERAWTAIRDSNLSTLTICVILWVFGRSFGASAVQGFAITLGLGLILNLFTAVIVTQTFLHLIVSVAGERLRKTPWLLGV